MGWWTTLQIAQTALRTSVWRTKNSQKNHVINEMLKRDWESNGYSCKHTSRSGSAGCASTCSCLLLLDHWKLGIPGCLWCGWVYDADNHARLAKKKCLPLRSIDTVGHLRRHSCRVLAKWSCTGVPCMQSDSSMVMRTGVPFSTRFCSMRTSSTSHMYESDGDITILVYTKVLFSRFPKMVLQPKKYPCKKFKICFFSWWWWILTPSI